MGWSPGGSVAGSFVEERDKDLSKDGAETPFFMLCDYNSAIP
jgi:hypothetical protein